MRRFTAAYVRIVERVNYRVGRVAMYLLLLIMAVLLWSSFTKTVPFMRPSLWTLEVAQFLMVAYYVLGGPYSIQLDKHVRMDLVYGSLSLRRKAMTDVFTIFFLIVYLIFLLVGALDSFAYSLGHFSQQTFTFFWELAGALFTGGIGAAGEEFGVLERSRSVWRPVLWPIKLVMIVGIVAMLLQALAELIIDIERYRVGLDDPFKIEPEGREIV